MKPVLAIALALVLGAGAFPAQAQIARTGSQTSPIASTVTIPAGSDLIYVSGALPSPLDPAKPTDYGDTEAQTRSVIRKLKATLEGQGLTLGDVVMMRVYLTGVPALGGKMDFAGMMKGYNAFFGTPQQPNKPARATVQVAALVIPTAYVEIEVTAARARR
jgi:enamine deaminase RidA (YjgF/YER057c/UK114 family)